jgi:hypothetical protein
MKASIILGLGLALAASGSFAQQPQTYHAKKTPPVREKKTAQVALPTAKTTNSSAAKDLHRIEQQSNKPLKMASPKPAPASAALKTDKPTPMPPINAASSGGMGTRTKSATASQGKNPLNGRLRQKRSHQ